MNVLLTLKPNYQQFQELFANEYALKLLVIIYQQCQKDIFPCAADLSKVLGIHISTVSKYLELLSKYNLIEKSQNLSKPGKPTYYKSQVENLSILLDFKILTDTLEDTLKDDVLFNPVLRENPNLPPRVIYNIDDLGNINSFTISQKTKAKRIIKRNISLTDPESQFMKYLPYPTMEPRPFLDICQEAGINDVITIKKLQFFIEKLKKYEILDLGNNRGKNNE